MPGALSRSDTLMQGRPRGKLSAMSRRARNIVLIVAAAVVVLWIVGYTVFNMGGSTPGSGEGDVITRTTP
jgi:hypothetical protein